MWEGQKGKQIEGHVVDAGRSSGQSQGVHGRHEGSSRDGGGRIEELDLEKEQHKEYVAKALSFNMDVLQALLNTTVVKLTKKNETLEDIMMAIKTENKVIVTYLNTKIKDIEGEFALCRVVVRKEVLGTTPNHKVDIPKLENFKRVMSTRKVNNFL